MPAVAADVVVMQPVAFVSFYAGDLCLADDLVFAVVNILCLNDVNQVCFPIGNVGVREFYGIRGEIGRASCRERV